MEYTDLILYSPLLTEEEYANDLALHLNIKLILDYPNEDNDSLYLLLDENGLSLCKNKLRMRGDFTNMLSRLKHNNLSHEMVVKAAKIKNSDGPISVIDATAGMGEDSLLLAAAGFRVTMFEYDPIIAALLKDTIRRAQNNPELIDIVGRMNCVEGDSIYALNSGNISADVILLDPMFPERNKTAMIKKKFQLLQQLEKPCSNEDELLNAAINSKPKKIIIKRPAKGPYLAGIKPDYSLDGKAIRYDCLVNIENRI